jgi:hypothetical protein
MTGLKHDQGKNCLGLVFRGFSKALWAVVQVGTFGANKYKPDSWQEVEQERYQDALLRHLFLYFQNEKIDEESGFNHLAHVAWNALAILNMELEDEHAEKNQN